MEAIYRLGVVLDSGWNAAVVDHRYQPAVHIFGVTLGTCPPGTYLKTAPQPVGSNSSALAAVAGNATAGGDLTAGGNLIAGAPARLNDLHLIAPGGAAIELSTQFEPNTTVYGAMVSQVSLVAARPCCQSGGTA